MAFSGMTIARYLRVFEECLDLPAEAALNITAEVRTHLEDAVEARPDQPPQTEQQATRLLGSPRRLAARLTMAELMGGERSSWWAVAAWRRWRRMTMKAPKSRLGASLLYLGPMAFIQFWLPRGGWAWLTFLAVIAGLLSTAAMSAWGFARLTRIEAIRVAIATTSVSVLAAAVMFVLAIGGVVSGNSFSLVFWPVALIVVVAGSVLALREHRSLDTAEERRRPLEA